MWAHPLPVEHRELVATVNCISGKFKVSFSHKAKSQNNLVCPYNWKAISSKEECVVGASTVEEQTTHAQIQHIRSTVNTNICNPVVHMTIAPEHQTENSAPQASYDREIYTKHWRS